MYKSIIFILVFYSKSLLGQGDYFQYQPITLDFEIEATSETASINPFLDYRLDVEFYNDSIHFIVPGYYAADGDAAETSASSGGLWRVHLVPNQPGLWKFKVHFKKGKDIAINDDPYIGEAVVPHHEKQGQYIVLISNTSDDVFSQKGRLQYHKSGYYFHENGDAVLKLGANSPENFLAYEDFDSTYSYDPDLNYLKSWQPHVQDWKSGDPSWHEGKGKGIIGALNYLADKGMNAVYALTMNIEGDARDVWPFLSHHRSDFSRYDVSKLAQWDIVFTHAERLGIIMQLITQEKENELLLDDGDTEYLRKLYYRELIARFGYHNNVIWNMGEENGQVEWWPQGQDDNQRLAMIRYLRDHDPYNNPIVIHTMSEESHRKPILDGLMGYSRLDGLSMQVSHPENVYRDIRKWIEEAEKSRRPWIISMDEIGPWHTGTHRDIDDPAHDTIRQEVLWGTLMAGGAGVEWYFGWFKPPHDLNAEDWRSRENVWEQTQVAKKFFQMIPYAEMNPYDLTTRPEVNYCFAQEGKVYVVYLKKGGTESLDLSSSSGRYSVRWYDPRKGGDLRYGSVKMVEAGQVIDLGSPPYDIDKDWTVLVTKN